MHGILFTSEYLKNYQGKAGNTIVLVTDVGIVPEYTECKFAQIANFNIENDAAMPYESVAPDLNFTNETEVYFGFNGAVTRQIFGGQTSEIFPISNLNQLVLQTRPGKTRTVWVTYFY
jgi:hypothetical protein